MTSLILRTAMRLIFPLALLFAAYMAIKGHNEPGGGFIGGLIAAVALALYRMSEGDAAMRMLLPFHPRVLIASGMAFATAALLVPLFFGQPGLRSIHGEVHVPGGSFHLGSALVFDVGVLLVVIGVSIGMIVRLSEEVDE